MSVELFYEEIFRIEQSSILIAMGASAIPLAKQTGRIMVVDDEVDIVFIIRRHLEKWGFDVDTFTDPQFALQTYKDHADRYSVALVDIRMPEMSGIDLANRMLKVKPEMNVVIMTAFEVEPDELALNLPMVKRDDILKKPFTLVQVCNAVKKQLKVQ
ncbi:MAG TPA: response regulator [Nitrososphaera sp.]|jgi:DNA-binding NtrC family response regulator